VLLRHDAAPESAPMRHADSLVRAAPRVVASGFLHRSRAGDVSSRRGQGRCVPTKTRALERSQGRPQREAPDVPLRLSKLHERKLTLGKTTDHFCSTP
jgi:hypothetical protein